MAGKTERNDIGLSHEELVAQKAPSKKEVISIKEIALTEEANATEWVSLKVVADELINHDDILILTHHYPDGDTLGSGFALHYILNKLGKRSRVICSHKIPERYNFMLPESMSEFEPQYICSVDVADDKLLGSGLADYAKNVDLCIDHHPSNVGYAKKTHLEGDYSATAMIIYELAAELGVEIDIKMAECIYTGISTDTGCFRFSNTSAYALRISADLFDLGIDYHAINYLMFNSKTRARINLERLVLEQIKFFFDDRCAVIAITKDMVYISGADANDMEGLTSLPRQVEGVWVGVTLRERADGSFKVSVRTDSNADASEICGLLGGGGHRYASGCSVSGTLDEVTDKLLCAISQCVPMITK